MTKVSACKTLPTLVFSLSSSNSGFYGPLVQATKGNNPFMSFAALNDQNASALASCLVTSLNNPSIELVSNLKQSVESCLNSSGGNISSSLLVESSGQIADFSLMSKQAVR